MQTRHSIVILLTIAAGIFLSYAGAELSPASRMAEVVRLDPQDDVQLALLAREAEALIEIAKAREEQIKAEQKRVRRDVGFDNMSTVQLERYFHGPAGELSKRDIRGLSEVVRLSRATLESESQERRAASVRDLREVMSTLRNNLRSPVPEKLGVTSPFRFAVQDWRRSVGRGTTIATNLAAAPGENNDPSQCDPLPSSFWTRPPNIADQDLYIGFGRSQVPSLADELCTYDGPKTSSGTRAGFDVECNGTRYKIKFGEVSSEPFTARLFHALGYHVDPTDFTPQVKVRYDRRVLREFNLRRPLTMRVRPLGIPMGSFALQPRYDPFKFIVAAVFRDGHSISGPELKKLLLHDPDANRAEETPQNFREDVEAALDCLIMSPANVQADETAGETIGPWAFVGLGHEHLRELRGAALLAGWLGWSDSRWDNTRLRAAGNRDGPPLLQHFFTDLGAGMGGDAYGFTQHGEDPNEFTWTFTRAAIVRGPGRMTTPFRVVDFRTMVPTPAFREMNVDDARWMARLIGQLTEEQIRAALIGSGYDAAEARLYQEKLVSRRDQMVRDLNLAAEIPLLRPGGVNRRLTLDPETDGPLTVVLKSGGKATARSSSRIVREGQVRDSTSLQDTSD